MFKTLFRLARPRPLLLVSPVRSINIEALKENKKWTFGGALSLIAAGVIYYYKEVKPALKEATQDVKDVAVALKLIPEEVIPPRLKEAKVTCSDAGEDFIERPALKAQIEEVMDVTTPSYTVVYGAKGMGKSEIVEHSAIGKSAVVVLHVNNASSVEQLMASLMKKLTINGDIYLDFSTLKNVMKECRHEKDGVKGFTPVIIFELERDVDMPVDALVVARNFAKHLIGYCRSIIVLSEATAVLKFTGDKRREDIIFVGEMTKDEATKLLTKLNSGLSKEEMENVFNTIGTAPQTLKALVYSLRKGKSVQDYIDMVLSDAAQDLHDFPLKPILKALQDRPEGVSTDYFNDSKYEGVNLSNAKAVGEIMKLSNCILYRIEHKKYQLQTTAHKTAIKSYKL